MTGSFFFGTMIPAMATPMTDTGEVDYDAAVALGHHLVGHGSDGLVLAGTTGESPTLTDDEKIKLFSLMRREMPDEVPIIAGVGTFDTAHSAYLAMKAEEAGADALLLVTPYYSKPTQAGLVAHFENLAGVTGLPVMLYDIPGRAGVPLSYDTLCRLAELPTVLAVKDAKADLAEGARVMANTDLRYFSGDDGLTLPWMALGAEGVVSVSAHAAPAGFRRLVDLMAAGDLEAARAANDELEPVIRGMMTRMPGAVSAKMFLQAQGLIPTAHTRLPLVPPTDAELELMRADMKEAGLHV